MNKLLADVLMEQKNLEITRNELRRRALEAATERGHQTEERLGRSRLRRLALDRLWSRL